MGLHSKNMYINSPTGLLWVKNPEKRGMRCHNKTSAHKIVPSINSWALYEWWMITKTAIAFHAVIIGINRWQNSVVLFVAWRSFAWKNINHVQHDFPRISQEESVHDTNKVQNWNKSQMFTRGGGVNVMNFYPLYFPEDLKNVNCCCCFCTGHCLENSRGMYF